MSMFENKTKPELEAGNFIAYADEPNTVVSGSGGGGGGIVYLQADPDEGGVTLVPQFSFNQVKNALSAGKFAVIKSSNGAGTTDFLYVETLEELPGDEENDPVYNVTARLGAGQITFTSNDPEKLMTVDTN